MRRGEFKGFEYEIPEENLDDIRLVDCIATVTDENTAAFKRLNAAAELLTLLLGKKQKEALYRHIGKDYGGRVPYEAVTEFYTHILTAEQDSKN